MILSAILSRVFVVDQLVDAVGRDAILSGVGIDDALSGIFQHRKNILVPLYSINRMCPLFACVQQFTD